MACALVIPAMSLGCDVALRLTEVRIHRMSPHELTQAPAPARRTPSAYHAIRFRPIAADVASRAQSRRMTNLRLAVSPGVGALVRLLNADSTIIQIGGPLASGDKKQRVIRH